MFLGPNTAYGMNQKMPCAMYITSNNNYCQQNFESNDHNYTVVAEVVVYTSVTVVNRYILPTVLIKYNSYNKFAVIVLH